VLSRHTHIGTSIAAVVELTLSVTWLENSMKKMIALLIVSLPAISLGADNPDESFFKDAAQAGMAEVAAGQTAQSKGSSQAVKDFGAMMVKDHSAANAKLKKIAMAKGVELPDGPSLMQKAMNKKTDMKSGDSFDNAYIEDQVKAHKDTIDLLQKEIDSGKDPDGKAFATETLPKVKGHLDKITKIAADKGLKS
jgi:putative membrane protein